ncbi:hypothetical protein NQ315_003589 [Exocentrus adspersus]|uniref:DDE Tnp4 domain-containing protein n=1 Tax=Exocentrus adspersus TaxID=1586481 RepID=A0AAV8VJZ8_9CUCU|nr:hypothetical protein NQ315_003589 [Exocentrus adspersus]
MYQRFEVPGVIGFIDCTHVAIVRPPNNDPLHPEHIYINRKNYHSINVQLVCDDSLRISNVNARFPGSTHDSHIWRESAVSRIMEQIYRQDEENNLYLLGDSGYPLRPWLMTPLEQPADRLNSAVKTAGCTIERCNGVLKNRWRCLLKHHTLHYTPTMAGKIINTCVVLHNMCLHYNVPESAYDEEMVNADFGMYVLQQVQDDGANRVGASY